MTNNKIKTPVPPGWFPMTLWRQDGARMHINGRFSLFIYVNSDMGRLEWSLLHKLKKATTGAILIRDGVSDEFMEEALSKIMDASVAYLKQAADMYKAGYVSLAALRENIRNAPKESSRPEDKEEIS